MSLGQALFTGSASKKLGVFFCNEREERGNWIELIVNEMHGSVRYTCMKNEEGQI